MKVKCKNCNYEWDYKGESKYWVSCPRCLYKVKSPLKKENKENDRRK